MIKQFKEFLKSMNESSSTWYPSFKAQGECINKKDAVTLEELNKIAYYFKEFYKMDNIQVGEIDKTPDKSSYTKGETEKVFGVIGYPPDSFSSASFCYYWKASNDPELEDIDSGWVGRAYMKERSPGQFMSPFQFLECVEMDYLYSYAWIEPVSKEHLKEMELEMNRLALKSPRRGRITGNRYGL